MTTTIGEVLFGRGLLVSTHAGHSTLRVSPAMAAGVTTRLFDVSDLVALLVESEAQKAA
jgi:hypothetical protein